MDKQYWRTARICRELHETPLLMVREAWQNPLSVLELEKTKRERHGVSLMSFITFRAGVAKRKVPSVRRGIVKASGGRRTGLSVGQLHIP